MDSEQRRGAGGIDHEARAAEAEGLGDGRRRHVEQRAGHRECAGRGNVTDELPNRRGEVVVGAGAERAGRHLGRAQAGGQHILEGGHGRADEDRRPLPVQPSGGVPGILERGLHGFDEQPLLRVHDLRPAGGDPVPAGGEAADVGQEGADVGVAALRVPAARVEAGPPPVRWHRTERRTAAVHQSPQRGHVRRRRIAAGHADDGDVRSVRRGRPHAVTAFRRTVGSTSRISWTVAAPTSSAGAIRAPSRSSRQQTSSST